MGEQFTPQGEERVTKKFTLPCSCWDVPTLEDWLAEKTTDGWWLCDWEENAAAPVFVQREAGKRQYWLEPAQKDAPPSADEIARHETMGWTYISRSMKGAFYVWRSTEETARRGRLRANEDSYAYSRVKKSLRNSYLSVLAVVVPLFGLVWFIRTRNPHLVWRLTADSKLILDVFSLALSLIGSFWVDRRERRALRRLKQSLAEGEPMRPVGRTGIVGKIVHFLPLIVIVVIIVLFAVREGHVANIHGYNADPVPFITSEQLGGAPEEECYVERRHTLLGGEIVLVNEGRYAGFVESNLWIQYSTQLEVYAPQLKFLAKPLADDVYAQYFQYCEAETLNNTNVEKAYYSRDIHDVQRLLLCDGGVVLYYRTDAPEDLRAHLDEFTALLREYQND